jgi:hypothetical protein
MESMPTRLTPRKTKEYTVNADAALTQQVTLHHSDLPLFQRPISHHPPYQGHRPSIRVKVLPTEGRQHEYDSKKLSNQDGYCITFPLFTTWQ